MKFSAILSIVSLAIGIAIGWVAKPTPEAPDAQVAKTDPAKISDRKEPKATPPPVEESERKVASSLTVIEGDKPTGLTDDQIAQAEKMQLRMGEMMKKQQQKKLDARIAKLVAQLKLTPAQEAALRKAMEENQLDGGSLMSGDFDPSQIAKLSGDGLFDEALADILTDEQKEEHEALKERELANKIESKALKSLARLSGLDMTQEQKDAAYDILYKQAEESASREPAPGDDVFSAVTASFGLEIDPDDLGLDFAAMGQEVAANGEAPSPQDIMARMKEGQQRKIDEKVEALSTVLNDDQLDQYRQSLEINQGGIFGGMVSGFGAEEESEAE